MKLQDFILLEKIKFDKDKLSDKYGGLWRNLLNAGMGTRLELFAEDFAPLWKARL